MLSPCRSCSWREIVTWDLLGELTWASTSIMNVKLVLNRPCCAARRAHLDIHVACELALTNFHHLMSADSLPMPGEVLGCRWSGWKGGVTNGCWSARWPATGKWEVQTARGMDSTKDAAAACTVGVYWAPQGSGRPGWRIMSLGDAITLLACGCWTAEVSDTGTWEAVPSWKGRLDTAGDSVLPVHSKGGRGRNVASCHGCFLDVALGKKK